MYGPAVINTMIAYNANTSHSLGRQVMDMQKGDYFKFLQMALKVWNQQRQCMDLQ
jgi:hypothetical protein